MKDSAQLLSDIKALARSLQNADGSKRNQNWMEDWKECAAEGLLALHMPKQYGGMELDVTTTIAALEAFGYGCTDNGLAIAINGQTWTVQKPIVAFGTDQQKDRYLEGLTNGTILGAHALTEAEIGSDAMSLKTTAEYNDKGYILNGRKVLVGMAPSCDLALVFASTAPENRKWGVSVFLVEADDEGVKRGVPQDKLGLQGTPFGSIEFENCWIPEDRLLGSAGAGMSIFNHTLEWERCFIFASQVGAMRRQLEECVEYARTRKVFDKMIVENQSVSNRLADMKVRLETSKLLLNKVAELKDQNKSATLEGAMTKLHISEAFLESSIDAVRIHGGKAFLAGSNMERDFRDSMGGVIHSGTSDIQRQIISRLL